MISTDKKLLLWDGQIGLPVRTEGAAQSMTRNFVKPLKNRLIEWGILWKLWGGRFPPGSISIVLLALWIPRDVPLWISSKLIPPLSSAALQAPHEPQHCPAAAIHFGSHTQVVLMIRWLDPEFQDFVLNLIEFNFFIQDFEGWRTDSVTQLNLNKLKYMHFFQDLIGKGAAFSHIRVWVMGLLWQNSPFV